MGKRVTILHILSGDLWAGAEAQILLQLVALREAGVDVRALIFNAGQALERLERAAIPCTIVEERQGLRRWFTEGLAAIRQTAPAIIVSHGYKEALLAAAGSRQTGAPLITTFHGAPEVHSGLSAAKAGFYGLLHYLIARLIARRIITVSRALAEELGFGRLEKVRTVFNVTALDVTAGPPVACAERSVQLRRPAVLIAGRLVPVKRVDAAIRAFAEFLRSGGNAVLYILGDGPERPALQTLATSLKLDGSVEFLGFRADSAELIARSDLLVISSEREGIPTVLLEAAQGGTPVLSTPLPGVREALEQLPGYPACFSTDKSAESLAAALASSLKLKRAQNPEISSALLGHFSPPAAVRKLSAIYRELCPDL